jgi:uncharacterized protein (TIGR03083 family)
MVDVGVVYAGGRERLSALVGELDAAGAATPVPACPEWRVHDVLAHLTGVCADILAGRLDGVATEPWTTAQVDGRREVPLADVLAEWAEVAPPVEAMAKDFGSAGHQWVADLATHEHDVRGALGETGARDSEAVTVGIGFLAEGFLREVAERGRPTLAIRAGERDWASAPGAPAATLTAPPFELLRATTGRRSLGQIRALGWDGDPEPWLPCFEWGPFTVRETALEE